jgi:hypothetical protein
VAPVAPDSVARWHPAQGPVWYQWTGLQLGGPGGVRLECSHGSDGARGGAECGVYGAATSGKLGGAQMTRPRDDDGGQVDDGPCRGTDDAASRRRRWEGGDDGWWAAGECEVAASKMQSGGVQI